MMKLEIQITTDLARKLNDWAHSTLPGKRKRLVQQTMRTVLNETIQQTPVDTGRAKAAWSAAQAAVQDDQRQSPDTPFHSNNLEGHVTTHDDQDMTHITATNTVPYISYLEYGTRHMSPFAMVRNSLLSIRPHIHAEFEI